MDRDIRDSNGTQLKTLTNLRGNGILQFPRFILPFTAFRTTFNLFYSIEAGHQENLERFLLRYNGKKRLSDN